MARHHGLRFLELGRSCVLAPYRNKRTVELLWHGIWTYVLQHNLDVMIGCASLEGTDPDKLALQLSFLHHYARAPEAWRARALPHRYVEMNRLRRSAIDPKAALRALPPLIKGYLRLGATFGDGAVIDRQFGTTDVLVILPVATINARYVAHFGPTADRHAAVIPARERSESRLDQRYSRRSATSSTRWLSLFFRIRSARCRVGRIFSCRLTRLMRVQIDVAVCRGFLVGKLRIAMEVGFRIAERGFAQRQKAIDIPALQHVLVGVEIDREIEKVGHERNRLAVLRQAAGLQHVQSFDDQNVRAIDLDPVVRHHVVGEMRIDRRARRPAAGLDVGEKAQQRRQVVAFGKALFLHQAFALENGIRITESRRW